MKRFGLIGYPLKNSFSVNYFTKKFIDTTLHNCIYENFPIEHIEEFNTLIERYPDLMGLNVTIPYKVSVIPYLTELDESAKVVGAVNCIKFIRDEQHKLVKLIGYNTDVFGFTESLKPLLKSNKCKALLLGTGGASKAVKYALDILGIEVLMVSRNPFYLNQISYAEIDKNILDKYTLIINCTPVGMFPDVDETPSLPYSLITPNHIAFDLIYLPEETVFLKNCRERGAITKNGLEMLHLQAEKAWEIW
jgi:shikimate dehydrogenase